MGFLKHLLLWPVTGPMYLARFSMEKVQGVVRDELTDDTRVKEALLDLQLRLELGEIDDDEYAAEEDRLMAELRDVRRWREEFGMGTRGGVVQVARDDGPPSTFEMVGEHHEEPSPAGQALVDETDERQTGGIASPQGAEIDFHFGFDDER